MKLKKTIKRFLIITACVVIGSGMLTLLIAANHKQQNHICKQTLVTIKGNGEKYSIDKSDIIKLLQKVANGKVINKPIADFDLARLESLLKTNLWISDADVYFDSQDVMHIVVTEKEPIARVFTIAGTSFYIDSNARQMPLLDKVSIRLPVFTNFPDNKIIRKDSVLLSDMKHLAQFINSDAFWSAQIAQIDITPAKTFEAVPTIGNHIIRLGTAEDLDAKFKRLHLFYQMVLSKTGFDKYSVLDVQYNNQIVATHKGEVAPIDSTTLQHNIQELLRRSNLQAHDEAELDHTSVAVIKDSAGIKPIIPVVKENPKPEKPKVVSVNSPTHIKPKQKSVPVKMRTIKHPDFKKPKAVMPKSRTMR